MRKLAVREKEEKVDNLKKKMDDLKKDIKRLESQRNFSIKDLEALKKKREEIASQL